MRRLASFTCKGKTFRIEPHCLARSSKYRSFILGCWFLDDERFGFIRYSQVRDFEVCREGFTRSREEYNPTDRKIGSIDTCVRRGRG